MAELAGLSWSDLVARLRDEHGTRVGADAWAEALRRVQRIASGVLRQRAGLRPDDRDDIVQRVMLRLQSRDLLDRLAGLRSPEGYVVVMVRNLANDAARRHRAERATLAQIGRAPPTEPALFDSIDDPTAAVEPALHELNADDRTLVRMRFWENMTIGEIAAARGVSYSAVAVRLFRLLRRLRDRIASH